MTTPAAQIRWALVGLLLCSGLCVFAPAASAADESNQPLEDRLQSTDPGVFAGAILEIKRDHAADIGRDGRGWLRILMDRGKYTDVEDLCLLCILQEPANVPQVEFLQQVRVRALLKAGKPKEALAQAKALFNVLTPHPQPRPLLPQAAREHPRQIKFPISWGWNGNQPPPPNTVVHDLGTVPNQPALPGPPAVPAN